MRGDSTRVVYPLFQTDDGGSTPTSPLQLHVGRVSLSLAIELNALWHSRLPKIDAIGIDECFGAEYGNTWYAVALWSKPVARMLDQKATLELRRLAIAPDAPSNTGSRLLAVMTRLLRRSHPQIATFISYQDTEVHQGTIYRAAGWNPVVARRSGEWDTPSRKRKPGQSTGDKIRWELAA
jgi:hypothetical protein